MKDDPQEIADHLITDRGLDGAVKVAVEGTAIANDVEDLYRLSVWRDVRRILKERMGRSGLLVRQIGGTSAGRASI